MATQQGLCKVICRSQVISKEVHLQLSPVIRASWPCLTELQERTHPSSKATSQDADAADAAADDDVADAAADASDDAEIALYDISRDRKSNR